MRPHDYWQRIDPAGALSSGLGEDSYVVDLDGGGQLVLPVRMLADGKRGLASLIINQASFAAQDRLAGDLARRLEPFRPEVVVGLPTLGLTLASAVARALGHERYVPLGTSRKFWYREELSAPLSSVTTPDQKKTLYLDPRMTRVLEGRRVALIDDVISSGASIAAGMALMTRIGVEPVVIGAVMLQSSRWRASLDPKVKERIVGLFSTPMLEKELDGRWRPEGSGDAGSTESGTRRTGLSMTAREDDGASSDWRPVAPAADVVEGRPHAVVVEGNLLVIVRTGETFRAAQGLCPHERGDLSSGRVEGGWLVCPRHLLSFDLGSGAPSKGWGVPALKLYPARKAGEQIEIDAAALRRDPPLGARTVWNLAPGAN